MKMPSPEEMRVRFHELTAEGDAIREKSGPLRQARDEHVNEARDLERKFDEEIREIETDLFDIDEERALLVRALGGKTGNPDGSYTPPTPEELAAAEAAAQEEAAEAE